jgi:hypothetical protein
VATEFERPTERSLERRPVTKDSGNLAIVLIIAASIAVGAMVYFTFFDTRGSTSVTTKPTITVPTPPATTTPAPTKK